MPRILQLFQHSCLWLQAVVHCEERNLRSKWSYDHALHWYDGHKGSVSNEVVLSLCGNIHLTWRHCLIAHILDSFPPLALEGQATLNLACKRSYYCRRYLPPTLHQDIGRHVRV